MKGLKVFLLSFVLLFAFGMVSAQEEVTAPEVSGEVEKAVTEAVNLDENIQPEDLGISEPRLLPDNPFYFLKNWGRAIQSFFAFKPVAKAELKLKFANEKLMEVKKMIEEKKDSEKIEKAAENYQKEIEKIKKEADQIREKAKESPAVESFLDKYIHQQTLHLKLLDRLENQVPPAAFEKIKEARERHLERFKDVMLKLEDRHEKITEKLDEILEKQKGSEFKEFKNLEVLARLEEKVPEEAKEAIQKSQEKALKRLEAKIAEMPPEKQELLKAYVEEISGQEDKHLEIFENLRSEIKERPEISKKLEEGKIKIIRKMRGRLKKLNCPLWTAPRPGFCPEGRVIIEKDPVTGCPKPPLCLVPGESVPSLPPKPAPPLLPSPGPPGLFCITLWDPVCGKDGKTYSNECFAKLAGVEIDYKGRCREEKPLKPEGKEVLPLEPKREKAIPPPPPPPE